PRAQIVVADGPAINSDAPATAATITAYESERVTLETNDVTDGYLFVKDAWYPGWHAWVDGQPASIIRADTYFRAIPLRAGAHRVELRFESEMVQWGAVVSGLTLTAWFAVAILVLWRRQ
ncbi:MAG: YfhO family protein, partial [Chloroflexota bacterium]